MSFGSAFKAAFNKASDAAKQKVAQIATTAKQAVNKAVNTAQGVAQKAKDAAQKAAQQAQEKAKFIAQQTAKAVNTAKQTANTAKNIAKGVTKKAIEKAVPVVQKAAEVAKQKALNTAKQVANKAKDSINKAKTSVQQKAAALSKKVKDAFKKIKKEFDDCKKLNKPIEACPNGQFLYGKVEDGSKVGKLKLDAEGALYKFKKETDNTTFEADVISGKAGINGSRISAEATALKFASTIQKGEDSLNPRNRIDSELKIGNVEAKWDLLPGYDTQRIGFAFAAGLSASAVSATVTKEKNIPLWGDWTVSIRRSVGGSVGSVGGSAGGHAYYNKENQRFHVGAFGELKVLEGIDLGLDISVGKKYTTRDR